jgi:type II secretory ATPase GspE/PulE/Tfp pilus assembly ATPase PilB-like protein
MLKATATLAEGVGWPLREISGEIGQELRAGGSLVEVMQRHPELFPPLLLQLILVAELSGDIAVLLKAAAEHYDREAAYEDAAFLPPLWKKETEQKSEQTPRELMPEHPAIRKVNEILAVACRRGAQMIDLRPENEDRGRAELTFDQQPDQKIAIEQYDRVIRRFRILAAIDPFAREARSGCLQIRWEGKDFSGQVESRPSAAGNRLLVNLRPVTGDKK